MTETPICIAPSILSADLLHLEQAIHVVESGGADWIHVDVMDGHFVPNLTFGVGIVEAVRRATDLPIDVHLMVEEPEKSIAAYAAAGAAVLTLHLEATTHVQRHLNAIREAGMRAGLALNPGTPLHGAAEVIDDLDLLLIMTVNPGYPAQAFIPASLSKIRRARQLLTAHGSAARLEVDGGISPATIAGARAAGADVFVAGSSVYGAEEPGKAIEVLRERARPRTLV